MCVWDYKARAGVKRCQLSQTIRLTKAAESPSLHDCNCELSVSPFCCLLQFVCLYAFIWLLAQVRVSQTALLKHWLTKLICNWHEDELPQWNGIKIWTLKKKSLKNNKKAVYISHNATRHHYNLSPLSSNLLRVQSSDWVFQSSCSELKVSFCTCTGIMSKTQRITGRTQTH